MGFGSLQHVQGTEIHTPQALPTRVCSALRVWLPSRRLAPSAPGPNVFQIGSAPGIHPSELSPRVAVPARLRADGPAYRWACRLSRRPKAKGRPRKPSVSGLSPASRAPDARSGISAATAGGSLGFRLSKACRRVRLPEFRRAFSFVLFGVAPLRAQAAAPWSFAMHAPRPRPRRRQAAPPAKAAFMRFLRLCVPRHASGPDPGYVFTFRRVVRYRRPIGDPWGESHALPSVARMRRRR